MKERQLFLLTGARVADRISTSWKIYLGFSLALAVIAVVAFYSNAALRSYRLTVDSVTHSYEVQNAFEHLGEGIRTAEAEHRGFLLTGDSVFLTGYEQGLDSALHALATLRTLTADDPEQQAILSSVNDAVLQRIRFLTSVLELGGEGRNDVVADLIRQGRTSPLRARLFSAIGRGVALEARLLEDRTATAQARADEVARLNLLALIGASLLLLGAVFLIRRDFRDRRRAEARLRESEERLRNFLDSANDMIVFADGEGRVSYANETWLRTLGYPADDVIGQPLLQFMAPESAEVVRQRWSEDGEAGVDRVSADYDYLTHDGRRITARTSSSVLHGDDGPVEFRAIMHDVTQAREIERMKDEFISVVSHELRTPLTSIRGALGLLAGGLLGELPERGRRMLDMAVTNTDRLVRLINDILDVERIESGEVAMTMGRVDIRALLEESIDVMRPMAERAQVTLELEAARILLDADPDRMLQTFTNLLSNAIKFSPAGETVHVLARAVTANALEVVVTDRGRGIPADKLESIFGRFQQVDASDSREKGGTGLGLAICRIIVEQHGGRIWAVSRPGEGSAFHVRLPRIAVGAGGAPMDGAATKAGETLGEA